MLRSMFSGVSGLRSHQTKMDVIGNNIANVNTVGFKASRVTFQEIYNQTLKAASAPTSAAGRGGVNAHQVGLGVSVASIDVLHTQTGAQRTDKSTDLALEGDGFFVVSDGVNDFYTRAGNFDIDPQGYLVSAGGLKVQGWNTKNDEGKIITTGGTNEINLANLSMPPRATSYLRFEGNLDSGLENGDIVEYTTSIIDALGEEHRIRMTFTKTNANEWELEVVPASENTKIVGSPILQGEIIEFDGTGKLLSSIDGIEVPTINFTNGSEPITNMTLQFDKDKMTQNDNESTFKISQTDGYEYGTLSNVNIDSMGRIIGIYSNGQARTDAMLAISRFSNPAGLTKLGDNLFEISANSGEPITGQAGIDGRAVINPGALEMSNVDLAQEFTEMIVTQRGFQANSRIITTSDELLQELVNLKR